MGKNDEYDRFDDIRYGGLGGVFQGAGSAAGDPLGGFGSVDVDVLGDGAAFELKCEGCGRGYRITLEYPELVALKFGMSPHEAFYGLPHVCRQPTMWRKVSDARDRGASWQLVMNCQRCAGSNAWKLPLQLGSREPEQLLRQARMRGFIDPRGEQQVQALVNQVKQQRRR